MKDDVLVAAQLIILQPEGAGQKRVPGPVKHKALRQLSKQDGSNDNTFDCFGPSPSVFILIRSRLHSDYVTC